MEEDIFHEYLDTYTDLKKKGANNTFFTVSYHVKFFIFTDITRRYYILYYTTMCHTLCTIQLCAIHYVLYNYVPYTIHYTTMCHTLYTIQLCAIHYVLYN